MKVAFLDFEFGQIYGSWRRDFLVTQAAVLIYDTTTNNIKIAEKIFYPNTDLVMRHRKKKNGRYKTIEYVINYHTNDGRPYDKKFKIKSSTAKKIRQQWNRKYFGKLKQFIKNTLANVDTIYVFGGNEDINILNRVELHFNNIIDIQFILYNTFKIRYSLDKVIQTLELNDFLDKNKIKSINYEYYLPHKKGLFQYNHHNLTAHNASGDCVRLFLVYVELILQDTIF